LTTKLDVAFMDPSLDIDITHERDHTADLEFDNSVYITAVQGELPHLLTVARRLTGNVHDASDLVQDALVRALRVPPPAGDSGGLRPWLTTILRHLHVDRLRRRAREPRPVPLDDASPAALCAEDEPTLEEDVELEQIEAAVEALPEEFRRVFVLHELEGWSYRDIASSLDIPMATVGTRLSRARIKLRGLLRRFRRA